MVANRPRCCPSCGKTMRLPRPIANPDCARELHIIFECRECGLSLIESATPPEVLVASATIGAKLRHFLADDSGATAIEYGLIAAGISVCHNFGCEGRRHKAQHDLFLDLIAIAIGRLMRRLLFWRPLPSCS